MAPRSDSNTGGGHGDVDGVATRLALSFVSASLSEIATFPIETIKTRLVLHHATSVSTSSNLLQVSSEIIAKGGGFLGFYSSLSPSILRHVFYTPIGIVGYENLRGFAVDADGEVSLFKKALAGGASGVFAQLVAGQADLVKFRMQANPNLYTGAYDVFSKIIKHEGFCGLWKGVARNAQRAFLVNMGELTCYDHAKHFILSRSICHDNTFAHTLSSVCSGLWASVISYPADLIKTSVVNSGMRSLDGQGTAKRLIRNNWK